MQDEEIHDEQSLREWLQDPYYKGTASERVVKTAVEILLKKIADQEKRIVQLERDAKQHWPGV